MLEIILKRHEAIRKLISYPKVGAVGEWGIRKRGKKEKTNYSLYGVYLRKYDAMFRENYLTLFCFSLLLLLLPDAFY